MAPRLCPANRLPPVPGDRESQDGAFPEAAGQGHSSGWEAGGQGPAWAQPAPTAHSPTLQVGCCCPPLGLPSWPLLQTLPPWQPSTLRNLFQASRLLACPLPRFSPGANSRFHNCTTQAYLEDLGMPLVQVGM